MRPRLAVLAACALVSAAPVLRAQHAALGLATGADAPVALTAAVPLGKGWALRGASFYTSGFRPTSDVLYDTGVDAARAGSYPDEPGTRTTRAGGRLAATFHRPLGRGFETYVGPYAAALHRVDRTRGWTYAGPAIEPPFSTSNRRAVWDALEAGLVLGLDLPVVGRLRAYGEGRMGLERTQTDRPRACGIVLQSTAPCTGRETVAVLDAFAPRLMAGLAVRLDR